MVLPFQPQVPGRDEYLTLLINDYQYAGRHDFGPSSVFYNKAEVHPTPYEREGKEYTPLIPANRFDRAFLVIGNT